MTNGFCPKCNNETIFYSNAEGVEAGVATGNSSPFLRIYKDNSWTPDISLLQLEYYVCQTCGYFESHVHDVEELSKLDDSTNWRKITPTKIK